MTHSSRSEKWHTFSVEEKLDALHEDIVKLFGIAEDISHRQHVFTDAIQHMQSKLEDHIKGIEAIKKPSFQRELVN